MTDPQPVKKPDVRMLDLVDGLGQFTENFELHLNKPDYDFMLKRMGRDYLEKQVIELNMAIRNKDDVEIIERASHVAFLALTQAYITFRQFGCTPLQAQGKVRAAMGEVCHTNLMKTPPTKAGEKITKPEGWQPPRIADLFRHTGQGFMSQAYREEQDARAVREAAEAAEDKTYETTNA